MTPSIQENEGEQQYSDDGYINYYLEYKVYYFLRFLIFWAFDTSASSYKVSYP